MSKSVTVVGGGLAGSECAWQLAERGVPVVLIEQKPNKRTPAQEGDGLAELVCSNSFRGAALHNAIGLLKEEMRRAGSLIIACGDVTRVPAGGAFAVDRERFSDEVTKRIKAHPLIELRAEEVLEIPDAPCVLATGPLTGDSLASDLAKTVGDEHLAYYDAIAPIISADSLDWDKVWKASRYGKGGDDYVNCGMTEEQYNAFVEAILAADKVTPREFEEMRFFEGCLPVEVMAERGLQTLAFGPLKPVGLEHPETGERFHAVVQLRAEDNPPTAYNMVGFQTRMKWGEQKRVFGMIPGLESAEFVRLGSVHRNTFIHSPVALDERWQLKAREGVWLAGQVAGVEGYVESAACGLSLGVMIAALQKGEEMNVPPAETALGALLRHLRRPAKDFQPSNVMFSMFPPLGKRPPRKRRDRRLLRARIALEALTPWLEEVGAPKVAASLGLEPSPVPWEAPVEEPSAPISLSAPDAQL